MVSLGSFGWTPKENELVVFANREFRVLSRTGKDVIVGYPHGGPSTFDTTCEELLPAEPLLQAMVQIKRGKMPMPDWDWSDYFTRWTAA